MKNYKKISFYIEEDIYNELERIIHYRNSRILALDMGKKFGTVEEFSKGCLNYYLKQLRTQDSLAGIDDLGKPFRLKNRFNELMLKRGLRQIDVSSATEIKPSNINKIFKNENQPSLDYFLRLWVFFGCPPLNDVLYREEE